MSRLFIAEKPSMGKEIANVLAKVNNKNIIKEKCFYVIGNDIVTWAIGHILENYKPEDYDENFIFSNIDCLPIIPNVWKLKIINDKKIQFNAIKKLINDNRISEIINAGDPDREGQLLIDEILDYIGNTKTTKRILLNALDEKSISLALKNLKDNEEFITLKKSALARSRADWLIGMNLSRVYSNLFMKAGYTNINIGRVMTPTMCLVVRREKEISNFVPKQYFKVVCDLLLDGNLVKTTWQPNKDLNNNFIDSNGKIFDRLIANNKIKELETKKFFIKDINVTNKIIKHKLPYSLSSLQIEAGKKYKYSPQEILQTMQSLYEKKLTTYPRSDCEFLPENQFEDAKIILHNLSYLNNELLDAIKEANINIKSQAWNDKKITAHHGIIPTTNKCNFNELSDIEKNLYVMVAKVYVAQFLPLHEYKETKIIISDINDENFFNLNGKTITNLGWKKLFAQTDNKDIILPNVNKNSNVSIYNYTIEEKETTPPTRYTTSTLLQAMKEIHKYCKYEENKNLLKGIGIGTEATRSNIIEKLLKEDFIFENKDKFLYPTEKGIMINNLLP